MHVEIFLILLFQVNPSGVSLNRLMLPFCKTTKYNTTVIFMVTDGSETTDAKLDVRCKLFRWFLSNDAY